MRASASSRIRREPREILAQVDARWVNQQIDRQALILAAHGVLGERVGRDFQAVVGGLNGLRAYPVQALAGQRLWRFNLEDRWTIGENLLDFVSVGAVAFGDIARAWGPGAAQTRWYTAVGTGVRIALPRWSPNQILRLDVAWPVQPTRDGRREPVLLPCPVR